MLNDLFSSILSSTTATSAFSIGPFLLCTVCSLILGALIAWAGTFRNSYSKSFIVSLALLPAIVQMVIMLVNGNLGAGVAVMGAFSLVRFRSIPGNARDISSIFLAMAVGLATGMGYLAIAVVFVLILLLAQLLYAFTKFGERKKQPWVLSVTIPESLNYPDAFDDLFEKYTKQWELIQVKTSNMGSLFKLNYRIELKKQEEIKAFLDELRCRNGNLEIRWGMLPTDREEL